MQLTYRGVTYDYQPTHIDTEPVEMVGRYRGQKWSFKHALNLPVIKPALELVYRGVHIGGGQYAT